MQMKGENLSYSLKICLSGASKKIIAALLKSHKAFLEEKDINVKEGTILSIISKAKAKGHDSSDFLAQLRLRSQETKKPKATTSAPPNDIHYLAADVYEQYEQTLRRNNSLDFDDLLLFGVKLFTEHKGTVAWCRHVLVDEL